MSVRTQSKPKQPSDPPFPCSFSPAGLNSSLSTSSRLLLSPPVIPRLRRYNKQSVQLVATYERTTGFNCGCRAKCWRSAWCSQAVKAPGDPHSLVPLVSESSSHILQTFLSIEDFAKATLREYICAGPNSNSKIPWKVKIRVSETSQREAIEPLSVHPTSTPSSCASLILWRWH